MRTLAFITGALCFVLLPCAYAQNWKQVHKADEAKSAKITGLDPTIIHKLWRAASRVPDEKDDDSRIANLDLEGLAERHDVLLVTYAGENNCLTLTVFRQYSESKFEKLWSVEQPPDGPGSPASAGSALAEVGGTGFCDTTFGSAQAEALNGAVMVRVPRSVADGSVNYTVYSYEWNGVTYHFAGQKEIQGR